MDKKPNALKIHGEERKIFMKKRTVALFLSAMMSLGIMTGCGGTKVSDGGSAADNSSGSSNSQEVELWYYWETEGHQVALQGAIDDFNASQDNYTMVAKYVPFADFKKQLSIGAVAE